MYINLSWRNIWRNKKRTLIAVASVFFAVIIAVSTRSMQLGSYAYMIKSTAHFYTGFLQIQQKGYWDNQSLDYTMDADSINYQTVASVAHVTAVAPRLESFALLSYGKTTRVGQVIGIDPIKENRATNLKSRLVKGRYLNPEDRAVLISQGLAKMLNISVGDSLILYGQAYQGQIAAGLLPVQGIVKYPVSELNNTMVYLPLPVAQELYLTGNRLTSLAVMIDAERHLDFVKSHLTAVIPPHYTVLDWKAMLPDLHESIQFDNVSGKIMLAILYVVIAFGVFGTIIMMMNERKREFGILISIGMKKIRLIFVTFYEILFISFIGALSGILGAIPIVWYFSLHPIHMSGPAAQVYDMLGIEPIFCFSTNPYIFLNQALVVFIIALVTFAYPLFFLRRLQPSTAIRS